MDNRVVSAIASKRKRRKRKPRPESLSDIPAGVSTAVQISNKNSSTNHNSSPFPIPELTITPPEDDGNPNQEIFTPPEVNILSQSSSKRKKKKKKQTILPVIKDEVRPSVVLGYTPHSLCKSVTVQPTVSEVEEVGEEAEPLPEYSYTSRTKSRSSSRSDISQSVPELPEEEDESFESSSLTLSESAYGSPNHSERCSRSSESVYSDRKGLKKDSQILDLIQNSSEKPCCFSESLNSILPSNSSLPAKETEDCKLFEFNSLGSNCAFEITGKTDNINQAFPTNHFESSFTSLTPVSPNSHPEIEGSVSNLPTKTNSLQNHFDVQLNSVPAAQESHTASVLDKTSLDPSTGSEILINHFEPSTENHDSNNSVSENSENPTRDLSNSCAQESDTTSILDKTSLDPSTVSEIPINHFEPSTENRDSKNFVSENSENSTSDLSNSSLTTTSTELSPVSSLTSDGMPDKNSEKMPKPKPQWKTDSKGPHPFVDVTATSTEQSPVSSSTRDVMPDKTSEKIQKPKPQWKTDNIPLFDPQRISQVTAQALQNEEILTEPKPSSDVNLGIEQKTKAQLKAERKAAFEAKKGGQLAAEKAQSSQKSKAELRAERRAIQDAQRAVKDAPKAAPAPSSDVQSQKKAVENKMVKKETPLALTISDIPGKKAVTTVIQEKEKESVPQKRNLFSHLPRFHWDPNITSKLGLSGKSIHPAIIRTGLKMAQGLISGSDARCVATLAAFHEVIRDYTTPPQKELSRDLDSKVKSLTEFLNKCRPLSVSMTNAIKQLRWHINQIQPTMKDADAKEQLYKDIETFIEQEIILSKQAIANFASGKIHDGDTILVYGCSPVVKEVLSKAQEIKTKFKVIVVDARPSLDGREMVRYLNRKKIECSYVLINAVSYVMKEVNLVLLDCHSLQANGYVMSRVGSSQIALVAQASNVPVLVCCETYKFCDRVHTDAFVDNELGNPEDLVTSMPAHRSQLENWKDNPHLNLVNLTYDVTPADLVTAVITELSILPCTSVPVVLRVKQKMSDVQK